MVLLVESGLDLLTKFGLPLAALIFLLREVGSFIRPLVSKRNGNGGKDPHLTVLIKWLEQHAKEESALMEELLRMSKDADSPYTTYNVKSTLLRCEEKLERIADELRELCRLMSEK
jgi:hypothetical protein